MDNIGAILFLYAETPVHAGSGDGLGAVDLPIQRERMSGLPLIQGSGIKGAWREAMRARLPKGDVEALFGPPPPSARIGKDGESKTEGNGKADDEDNEYAGAMSLVDARLLLFPVRTVWGGWAWLTSPMVLQRLARDLELLGLDAKVIAEAAQWTPGGDDAADSRAAVTSGSHVARSGRLLVEDIDYAAVESEQVTELAKWLAGNAIPPIDVYKPFRDRLEKQLAIVSDSELAFLSRYAAEVVTRVRIKPETGTVQRGALWTEESLPAETLLWSTALFSGSYHPKTRETYQATDMRDAFCEATEKKVTRIRLGGDRTVGRGLVGVSVLRGGTGEGAKR